MMPQGAVAFQLPLQMHSRREITNKGNILENLSQMNSND